MNFLRLRELRMRGGKGRAAAPQGPGPRGRPPHSQPPIPAFGARYPRILSSISGGRILDPPPTLDPAFLT